MNRYQLIIVISISFFLESVAMQPFQVDPSVISLIHTLYPETVAKTLTMPEIIGHLNDINYAINQLTLLYSTNNLSQITENLKIIATRKAEHEKQLQEAKTEHLRVTNLHSENISPISKQYKNRLERNITNLYNYLQKTDKKNEAEKIISQWQAATSGWWKITLDLNDKTYGEITEIYKELKELFFTQAATERKRAQEEQDRQKEEARKAQEAAEQAAIAKEKQRLKEEEEKRKQELEEQLQKTKEAEKKAILQQELATIEQDIADSKKTLQGIESEQKKILDNITQLFTAARMSEDAATHRGVLEKQLDAVIHAINEVRKTVSITNLKDLSDALDMIVETQEIKKLEAQVNQLKEEKIKREKNIANLLYDTLTIKAHDIMKLVPFAPVKILQEIQKKFNNNTDALLKEYQTFGIKQEWKPSPTLDFLKSKHELEHTLKQLEFIPRSTEELEELEEKEQEYETKEET